VFETPLISAVRGITLKDPSGAWPESLHDISGTPEFDGSAVNEAMWLDQDTDGFPGVTSYVVPPGGVQADGAPPDPPRNYGSLSPVCPRGGGTHTPYAYWPVPSDGLASTPVRIKRLYIASRVISAYKGSITSCDQIAGDIVGPNGAQIVLEGRVGGCIREHGDTETACANSAVDFLDNAAMAETVQHATFLLKRWPSDIPVSCSQARAFSFD
jgi:hypothetical protein